VTTRQTGPGGIARSTRRLRTMMVDLAELKAELKWCLENGNRGPRTEAALLWALELVEEMELEREKVE